MLNRRILYIGIVVPKKGKGGADIVNARNIKLLKENYGDNLYIYELNNVFSKSEIVKKISLLYNLLRFNVGAIRESEYLRILEIIEQYKIDDIFLSTSIYGKLSIKIKKRFPNIRIISFFHNIEVQYNREECKINKSLTRRIISQVINKNESHVVENSDILITLNNRDAKLLYEIYNKNSTLILPTSFDDVYNEEEAKHYTPLLNGTVRLLFVGVNFFANTHGIKWFIDNVLPNIPNAHLTIAGRDMDKVLNSTDNITVCGYVDDLAQLYYKADVVVLPIFYGGGMKTKTAEALMYGCPVVATDEALEGYDFNIELVGVRANTKEEMIKGIKSLISNKDKLLQHRINSRNIYNEMYNTSKYLKLLKEILLLHI